MLLEAKLDEVRLTHQRHHDGDAHDALQQMGMALQAIDEEMLADSLLQDLASQSG